MKKVAIIGTAGLPAKYGGFETLANYLTLKHSNNVKYCVFCQKNKIRPKTFNDSELIYLPFKANGIQSLFYDIISIIIAVIKYDVLLILGTPGCIILPFVKILSKKKIIVNLGGLGWKRDKWNIIFRKYLKYSVKLAVVYSDIIISDNQYFVDYIYNEYNTKSRLIEYGGDHAKAVHISSEYLAEYNFLNKEYFVSVSRAQIDNNIEMVLEAFILSKKTIVLISNWSSCDYGKYVKNKYSNINNLILLDAIYDNERLNVIRTNAIAYIHSHSFCGSAPSLIEAMSLGKAIITFDTETNVFTTEGKAIYFKNTDELSNILNTIDTNILEKNSSLMSKIANKRYNWDRIIKEYENCY